MAHPDGHTTALAEWLAGSERHYPVPPDREAEHARIVRLLEAHATNDPLARPLAHVIAAASLKPTHLWRGLALPDRESLGALLGRFFPELAAQNTMDMRWKMFFYKKLCGWEGFDS